MAQLPEKIKWSFRASLELVEIHEYLTENSSKQSADKYINGILKTVDKLALNPKKQIIPNIHTLKSIIFQSGYNI